MKKSIVRTSLALAIAGVLGTSVVAYAAEAPQIQPVPVVKQEATENTKPVVVPAVANPAAASMDADTTPVVAKDDKKDAKTTKVVKTEAKDHKTTKVVKSNKKVQPTQSVKTHKAVKTVKAN